MSIPAPARDIFISAGKAGWQHPKCRDVPGFTRSYPRSPASHLGLFGDSLSFAKSQHFRRLGAKSQVSGEEFWASRAKRREFRVESLLAEFSISEIRELGRSETGCVWPETGSNPRERLLGTGAAAQRACRLARHSPSDSANTGPVVGSGQIETSLFFLGPPARFDKVAVGSGPSSRRFGCAYQSFRFC
jgi:hypothetical protein